MIFLVSQATGSVFSTEDVQKLRQNFFANIHTNGAIVAAPSKQNPDYYYDWIRDSAIAMGLIESWYEHSHAFTYKERLLTYVSWTRKLQHQYDSIPGQDILGEPKFYIDGYPFEGPWGRPQNDGPALRASVLIRFAQLLLDENEVEYVRSNLYDKNLDPDSMGVIKMDLEYTAHHWSDKNYDLWEEVLGHHFFTAMVQQKALQEGAALARRLNDNEAAIYYEQQAKLIKTRLNQHLDSAHKTIQATLLPHPGPRKTLELDSSIILGVLLNLQADGDFSPSSFYVKNTVQALYEQFNSMFPINKNHVGEILFGRYPGDTYDGHQTNSIGNPWFILTATMAEYYYTLADNLPWAKHTEIAKHIQSGDNYLKLIKKYAPNMKLSEQINLNTGIQQGAPSLTWSYVAVLRAIELREKLTSKFQQLEVAA
ncbi:glycoside hydrolase family 15 protein [Fluoribacter dumoffii]|uniref:glucan 1,4-alpha-glucosidase n=1 Tax=Fluoribacter dumoffii TaxID=463 RepID=A0A377GE63_9GAMM|nr:glycoside hydrolase family 15 protein [Fluoribacter dumoffii]KTC90771.1 glucan 1,4-alpha-glucosidase [Fluoribacter dumoffii NY 23]MCW8386614.1 glycoside hydrolase family 15 protein [Fluoribacter dumoffii]MCW8419668.1 glycoside hydrolase family 15 protein [Fluoribacter dumoffii]MCW8455629.1 glycoside hydrolase family 15 protein [Fluoribacter dumoffii]MCW8460292.1 glycoside hydrolase family 15 protein [Fluoribacter dumoffii]